MNAAADTVVPVSVTAKRLENHRDYYRQKLRQTPWWQFKRLHVFAAAAAVYDFELDALLELGGASVMKRLDKLK